MNTTTKQSNKSDNLMRFAIENLIKKQNPNIVALVNNALVNNAYLSKEPNIIVPERPVKSEPSKNTYIDIQPVNLNDTFEQNK